MFNNVFSSLFRTETKAKLMALDRSQAIIEFNLDGTILNANQNFLDTMGYQLNEIQGRHHSLFVNESYAASDEYKQFWEDLKKGEFKSAEFPRINKRGETIWIQASYNPLFNQSGKPFKIVKFATDITRKKNLSADHQGQINAIRKSQAVIEFDLEGNILTANDIFLAVTQYQLNEIKGKHHSLFVDPVFSRSQEYKEFWSSLKQGKFHSGEYKRINKNGKDIWIQATYNPIFTSDGKPVKVVKYAIDITADNEKNAYYAGQINAISRSQAVIEFELDGTIVNANENFMNAVGYQLHEIKGKHHSIFVEENERNSNEYRSFWERLNKGQFESGEFKRFGKNNEEIWIQASYNPIFDSNGKPYRVIKYATDITESKRRNADYTGQIEAIGKSQAVIEFEMDGTIIKANTNFLNAVGYSLQEIQGKHHSIFVSPNERDSQEYQQFWAALNRGEFQAAEYQRFGKNNHSIWIQATYNPIFDHNGKPFKVVKYATDITARKAALDILSKSLMGLSEGNLNLSIDKELDGEFEQLREAMNTTISRLSTMVNEITQSSNTVASNAQEIEHANLSLSERTESQASSLEETSSSIEELTSTVENNAANTNKANDLVFQASDKAEHGGHQVKETIAAMSEIENSSKRIADIIGVIDEIAFQTNLLALNAAVEAARAGEQGRGFAVVAGEVRNLAQRSADSAKEIKNLIMESVSRVSQGARMVSQSGHVFDELVSSIKDISELIVDINNAGQEQAGGINQVREAIVSMEAVTQQNSAMVEEAAASSKNMSVEAKNLLKQVQFFSVNSSQ